MLFRAAHARRVVRRAAAISVAGTGAAGTAAILYANTDQGLGFKRQAEFWWNIGPVIFDYWWNSYPNSPKVKLQAAALTAAQHVPIGKEEENEARNAEKRKELLTSLHERNAPKIFHSMLQLGGLYIKLGQVLSVTVLPIPEQYRTLFRTLQSNVPGASDFESVVKPTLEKELGAPLEEIFESIDAIPCGAASIGQAHHAVLRDSKEEVIVKVQYPNARWQIPADIECVGDFLHVCVLFGIVDESSSSMSYDEFARQFVAELDYAREKENLKLVHQSSLDPTSPYMLRGVLIPRVFEKYCTKQVITMTYLPGPKFEEFAKKQLAFLGLDPERGVRSVVMEGSRSHNDTNPSTEGRSDATAGKELALSPEISSFHWKLNLSRFIGNLVSIDSMFLLVRFARRILLWSTVITVKSIQAASTLSVVPTDWKEWANDQEHVFLQTERWAWIQESVSTLIDVHGYQILNQGLFNADPHPGNILIVQDEKCASMKPKIGLIDYGQVKRLTPEERVKVAKLILSIANKESDDVIADNFRSMGIKTKSNSTRFLAEFGKLMFGSLESKHLDRHWHRELHKEDRILYFPTELSMVYRTTLLLRGLAMSLQFNPSVGEEWRHHAEQTIKSLHGVVN